MGQRHDGPTLPNSPLWRLDAGVDQPMVDGPPGLTIPRVMGPRGDGKPGLTCTGFGGDKFLHSSLSGAVIWVCAEKSADSTGAVSALPEQSLHSIVACSAPQCAPPASSLLGGDTAGTADPK